MNYPAMTIETQSAPAARRIRNGARHEVWPWLVQMGAGSRAGWYSYDFLDNGRRPSAHHPRAPTAGRRHDLPGGAERHRRLHAARLRTGALSHSRLDEPAEVDVS